MIERGNNMVEDKNYCMSSFLMLRTIYDRSKTFNKKIKPIFFEENKDRTPVKTSFELENLLRENIKKQCSGKNVALALSGGIDSAILAKFLPENTLAYTFKCIVPGVEVTDETKQAKKYADLCGLKHKVLEIYWEDFEKHSEILMRRKGAPIHSIEVQIYKAALAAKADGVDVLIFGESADVNFGGQDKLLSKDWTIPEYIERYSYIMPHKVLVSPVIVNEPFLKYSKSGFIDAHEFNRHAYYCELMGSYKNAVEAAGLELCAPYSKTYLGEPLDYNRVRSGESKYLIREIFNRLYPTLDVPPKTPMPRPMDEWLESWSGPMREEFLENCINGLSGDQKWLVWVLEKFLNFCDRLK